MSSREELMDGSSQTQNLVLSFDRSEISHLFNKIVMTTIPGSLFPTSEFQGSQGLPWWSSGKESAFQCSGRGFDPWSGN